MLEARGASCNRGVFLVSCAYSWKNNVTRPLSPLGGTEALGLDNRSGFRETFSVPPLIILVFTDLWMGDRGLNGGDTCCNLSYTGYLSRFVAHNLFILYGWFAPIQESTWHPVITSFPALKVRPTSINTPRIYPHSAHGQHVCYLDFFVRQVHTH